MRNQRAWTTVDRKRWEAIRRQVLERDGWKCRVCGRRGRLEVDHVEPMGDGEFVYDLDHLQALCRGCHIRKTRRKNRERQARLTPQQAAWRALVDEVLQS